VVHPHRFSDGFQLFQELLFFKNTLEDLNGRCPKNSQVQQWWDVWKKIRQELGEQKNNGSKLSDSNWDYIDIFDLKSIDLQEKIKPVSL